MAKPNFAGLMVLRAGPEDYQQIFYVTEVRYIPCGCVKISSYVLVVQAPEFRCYPGRYRWYRQNLDSMNMRVGRRRGVGDSIEGVGFLVKKIGYRWV